MNVRYEIFSPDSLTIEILDGEAAGSKILMTFEEIDEGTEIETRIQLQSYGFFRMFIGNMIHDDVENVINSIISTFEKAS
jgi:carbon monoxide dehydrogenase subunit G